VTKAVFSESKQTKRLIGLAYERLNFCVLAHHVKQEAWGLFERREF
jgi:hypothetical protein